MNLLIRQKYEFSIKPTVSTPTFADGNISSKFTVSNSGNGADTFTLYIANNEDLLQNGWIAELGQVSVAELKNDGKMILNVSVASEGTSDIPIKITPISSNPSRLAKVLIMGYSQNDENSISSSYIILKYPELQVSEANLTVVGIGVSESVSGDQITNAGVMVISVASALMLFYYARRKRWIR